MKSIVLRVDVNEPVMGGSIVNVLDIRIVADVAVLLVKPLALPMLVLVKTFAPMMRIFGCNNDGKCARRNGQRNYTNIP